MDRGAKLGLVVISAFLVVALLSSAPTVSAGSWSVSSSTNWYDNASSSEVNVRTTVSNGSLKLGK